MSSNNSPKKNFDKKIKKRKITTINLNISSSSSSLNSSKKSSPQKIKQLFSDSENEDDSLKKENINKEEDLTLGFEKALNKKQFQGEKGKMLLKLQNSYLNDPRFKIDSKFKDDINYKKLQSDIKESSNNKKNLFNYEDKEIEADDEDIELEKKKNMAILAQILPNSAFLEHKSVDKPVNKLIIKRFDPELQLGNAGVEAIKKEIKENKENKGLIKLETGVPIINDRDDIELINKYYKYKENDTDKMKKREKEKLISDTINRINDEMNQEIKVNYDMWKKGIQEKNDNKFSLFGNPINNSNNEANNDNNIDNNNIIEEKELNTDKDNKKKVLDDKEILRRKKRREKQKMKKKEKQRIKKEKEKLKKEKIEKKMEEKNEQYKNELIQEFGEEKTKKYINYINMIKEHTNPNKNKK